MKEGELRNKRIDKSKKKGYIKYPFYVRPAWVLSNGLKSRVRPSSGKYIA